MLVTCWCLDERDQDIAEYIFGLPSAALFAFGQDLISARIYNGRERMPL